MGTYTTSGRKFFTIPACALLKFDMHIRRQKPGFKDACVHSIFCGWVTVFVPEWDGTFDAFHKAVED